MSTQTDLWAIQLTAEPWPDRPMRSMLLRPSRQPSRAGYWVVLLGLFVLPWFYGWVGMLKWLLGI